MVRLMGTGWSPQLLLMAGLHLLQMACPLPADGKLRKASCHTVGKDVEGLVVFMSRGDLVTIQGIIDDLDPGKHGLTINESRNVLETCDQVGAHFNPYGKEHGPSAAENSHLGDLGNVDAPDDLVAQVQLSSRRLQLQGNDIVVSHSSVVYEQPDNYDTGGDVLSKSAGGMTNPVGCGTIMGFGKHAASTAAAFALSLFVSSLVAGLIFATVFMLLSAMFGLRVYIIIPYHPPLS